MTRIPQEDLHETTTMDRSALRASNDRCPAALGSSLPISRPMEQDITGRPLPKRRCGGTHS